MKLNRYNSNVYYTDYDERTDRSVMGFVRGDEHTLAIDSGNSPKTAREFLHLINEEPDFIALTHYHWDHTFGLSEFRGTAISSVKTARKIDTIYNKVWNEDSFHHYCWDGSIEPFCADAMVEEYGSDFSSIHIRLPEITFKKELSLELGSCPVKLMKVSNPHSDDGVIIYLPEHKIVFMGDALYEELKGDQWIDHPNKAMKLLNELEQLDFDLAIPAHHDPMTRKEILRELKERSSL